MIVEGLLLGLLVGKLRGGQFNRLNQGLFRMPFFVLLAFALQLALGVLISLGQQWAMDNRFYMYIFSYCLLFLGLFLNLSRRSMWLILIGGILNFTAIMFNQGSMPIDVVALETLGFENMIQSIEIGAAPQYIPISQVQGFIAHLGKVWTTPSWYPLKQIFSIGDVLISLGLFAFIQGAMNARGRHSSSMIRFGYKGRPRKVQS
ncbi:conserved hypothetical protein [Alkaliphilus metalliredigens QYMF]|uniref:DUF5317 domain-containing protein n=1 Tax=Alkaliphilus metalliredigens (strain QYMF) TaxID=293826 RepID=A6TLE6_ALKMQ|nr:DUF5317 domain-containing protein [Alkaliphilus metalliredigens]ABR47014.1 conserved hypothetical protein [Alkaliphilus metalliredigens QYMF]